MSPLARFAHRGIIFQDTHMDIAIWSSEQITFLKDLKEQFNSHEKIANIKMQK